MVCLKRWALRFCLHLLHPRIWLQLMWRNVVNCIESFRTPVWYFAVFIPICCDPCLFQKWHKLWIKKCVGYQCSKFPAIPIPCCLVCRKNFAVWLLVCLPVILEVVLPHGLMLMTLRFEDLTDENIFWGLFPFKHQYHSTSLQLRHDVFMFFFVQ